MEINSAEFMRLLDLQTDCILIKTRYTKHYIERILPTAGDRGRWRWFAEMRGAYWDALDKDPNARRCHIDGNDGFPRYYFLKESMVNEFMAWIDKREQAIEVIRPYDI